MNLTINQVGFILPKGLLQVTLNTVFWCILPIGHIFKTKTHCKKP